MIRIMSETRKYNHPNGYSAILYGESSMVIQYNGKEVMHTGSRSVNTEGEVMELLNKYPKMMSDLFEDD